MRILRHYVHQAHIKVFGRPVRFGVHARHLMTQQTARTLLRPLLVAKRAKRLETKHCRLLGRFFFQQNESIVNRLI